MPTCMRCRRLASLASDQDWVSTLGSGRKEGSAPQPRVLLGEDLLQRALDSVEIGRGLRRADPSDGEGLRRRQRRLRIAPQVHHGRNACHRGGPGVFRPTLQELVGDDDEIGATGHALELLAEGPAHQRVGGAAVAHAKHRRNRQPREAHRARFAPPTPAPKAGPPFRSRSE